MPQSATTRVVLSMIAAICVTLITNVLDTSPTVSLIGATLAAAVPALITAGGPHGVVLGVGVTAVALGVTYFGFTAVDAATDRPPTFPLSADVREQLGETLTGTGENGPVETETAPKTSLEEPSADPEAGRQVFIDKGCGGCHVFTRAGTSGTTGPNLDMLSEYAANAGQSLEAFIRESIVNADAYVEGGFPSGVMPPWSGTDTELANLVAFLTQS